MCLLTSDVLPSLEASFVCRSGTALASASWLLTVSALGTYLVPSAVLSICEGTSRWVIVIDEIDNDRVKG